MFGKRYCINCIVILCESNENQLQKPGLKKIVREQDEEFGRYSESKIEKQVNIPHERVLKRVGNPGILNEVDEDFQKAIELSKKLFEEEKELKLIDSENKKRIQLKYPKPDVSENDEELEKALEQSMLFYENEKKMRENDWEKFEEPIGGDLVPEILGEDPQMGLPKPVYKKALNEPEAFNLNGKERPLPEKKYPDLSERHPPVTHHQPPPPPPPLLPNTLLENLQLNDIQIFKTDPKQDYDLVKKLATGSMGTVYIAKNTSTEDHCAVKIIETNSPQEDSLIINEVKLTINSHHKNIITYFKCYHFQKTFWVIEELMSCSLADLVLDMPERIPEQIISYILKSVLEAVHYLHSNNRLHRDIKSDNVLLSLKGEIKLGDLGFAAQLESRNQIRNTFAGTLLWMSPELLNQRPYTYKTDIWSLGIVAYELAEGEPPYYREGQQRIVVNILNQEAPRLRNEGKWTREFVQFLGKCLVKDPELRADARDLLDEPFIKGCRTSEEDFKGFFNDWLNNR